MGRFTTLGARAFLAAVLMIGFYVLALAIAGLLFWIPWAEYTLRDGLSINLAFFCVFAGGSILWSILPRIDRFPVPGPLLTRDDQPRLFDHIEQVSKLTGQRMPSEVYLVPEFNAWVAQRGGIMGIGSRRVMGLGLPLVHSLSVDEFRAVLAHEFGHFHGGDTRLGPWVYKTRAAIARTVAALESEESVGMAVVQAPFRGYASLFLRISQAVSRAQEFAADALSARLVGGDHLASGLRSIHATAPLLDAFWAREFAPLLGGGVRPAFGEGFRRFLATEEMSRARKEILAECLGRETSDPMDSHPALKLRLDALGVAAGSEPAAHGPSLSSIIDKPEALELRLLEFSFGREAVSRLEPIAWNDVGPRFYRPLIERHASTAAPALKGVTPESLPECVLQFHVRNERLRRGAPGDTWFKDQGEAAIPYLASALTLAASRSGREIVSKPGLPVLVRAAGRDIDFFGEIARLRSPAADRTHWQRLVADSGIQGVDLGGLEVDGTAAVREAGET